jgi:hypothetical protein
MRLFSHLVSHAMHVDMFINPHVMAVTGTSSQSPFPCRLTNGNRQDTRQQGCASFGTRLTESSPPPSPTVFPLLHDESGSQASLRHGRFPQPCRTSELKMRRPWPCMHSIYWKHCHNIQVPGTYEVLLSRHSVITPGCLRLTFNGNVEEKQAFPCSKCARTKLRQPGQSLPIL